MEAQAIQQILGDFNPYEPAVESEVRKTTLTIWLPAKDKARYDKIQKMSNRELSKKVREVIQAMLDMIEARAP